MNRNILSSMLTLIFFVGFVSVSSADMAMEGSGQYKGVLTVTSKALPMQNERIQVSYEAVGLVVEAPADSPFHNCTFYAMGGLHVIKGEYDDHSGFLRYTCPNGDNIFATYTGSGKRGVYKKITYTFVGGSGQFAGIEGGAELVEGKGLPHPNGEVRIAVSVGKVHWKIPQKKK